MSDQIEYVDENGCTWESYKDFVWGEVLGFCGCHGSSTEYVFDLLKEMYVREKNGEIFYFDYKNENKLVPILQELCLFVFDKVEITEHGGSVRGCWLSKKGKDICSKLFEDNNDKT